MMLQYIRIYILCYNFLFYYFMMMHEVNANAKYLNIEANTGQLYNTSIIRTEPASSDIKCASACMADGQCCSAAIDNNSGECHLDSCCFPDTKEAPNVVMITTSKQIDVMTTVLADCGDIKATCKPPSGVYTITRSSGEYDVYCDMDTDGGGWTVIQRRINGNVDFNRIWDEYSSGFGFTENEYWLGNQRIYELTNAANYELRIDIEDFLNNMYYAKYSTFSIGDEDSKYRLNIAGYNGNAGDSLAPVNGLFFSTRDRDNDLSLFRHCSNVWTGGWWFSDCVFSNLNGHYYVGAQQQIGGITWSENSWRFYSFKSAKMMIRRK